MSQQSEHVFLISGDSAGGVAGDAECMGFKAYNLWRMARIGLPVPPAFVINTSYCREYLKNKGELPDKFRELLAANLRELEKLSGLGFGGARKPLLVSVRSGAPVSMPGMMQTLLDVGITDVTVRGLIRLTGNPRLAWDSYRRLVQSYAEIVHGCPQEPFTAALRGYLARSGVDIPQELDFQSLMALTRDYLDLFRDLTDRDFPQNPAEQLEAAVTAVFKSWQSPKAAEYRRINGISDGIGTAVTVQRMVYGNAGGTSGSGVAFTRNPASGENALYMDFLFNTQGEDVVSGRHALEDPALLAELMPSVYEEIRKTAQVLEREFKDAQEFEFTLQDGKLYLLQTRSAKRAAWAALRIAVEQVEEGLISPAAAWKRLAELDLDNIQQTRLAATQGAQMLGRGIPASTSVATGAIALDSAAAQKLTSLGRPAILVRDDFATDDIAGICAAAGILTAVGGRTSHAAVVARELDKVCIVGCAVLTVDLAARRCCIGGVWMNEGDELTLDGNSGQIFSGTPRVVVEKPADYLAQVARWRAEHGEPKTPSRTAMSQQTAAG